MFYIIFDAVMFVIMFLLGILFYRSDGKAVKYLSGYQMKTEGNHRKHEERALCKGDGMRMILMSLPFVVGMAIDVFFHGIGCWIAWAAWSIQFVLLLIARYKNER